MGTVVSLLFRLFARIRGLKVIELIGAPRAGNHVFVTSPDLPGFSFMLRPGEYENIDSIRAVLEEPLMTFLTAEKKASLRDEHQHSVHVGRMRQAAPSRYLAELCTA